MVMFTGRQHSNNEILVVGVELRRLGSMYSTLAS